MVSVLREPTDEQDEDEYERVADEENGPPIWLERIQQDKVENFRKHLPK